MDNDKKSGKNLPLGLIFFRKAIVALRELCVEKTTSGEHSHESRRITGKHSLCQ